MRRSVRQPPSLAGRAAGEASFITREGGADDTARETEAGLPPLRRQAHRPAEHAALVLGAVPSGGLEAGAAEGAVKTKNPGRWARPGLG
jgi:hypothetical protein